ncbi:MAG: extracellular solute-binding protein [Anaerolineales bacterium]
MTRIGVSCRLLSSLPAFVWLVTSMVALAACGTPSTDANDLQGPLVLYSGRREALIQPLIDRFQAEHPGLEVALKAGDNIELANALLEEAGNPQADVFLTTEILTVEHLFQQGVLAPYDSVYAEVIPASYRQAESGWTPLTLRARVLMINTDLVSQDQAPASILDLSNPEWLGRVAAAGSTNGSMQAHVAALRQLLGDASTEAWLQGLIENQVTFFASHTDVRKAVGSGEFAIGLVNHYYYYLQAAEGSPVGVIYPDQGPDEIGLVVNASSIGLVTGARHPAVARAWIDFLLSEGQQLFAELNYEYPIDSTVPLREGVHPLDDLHIAEVDLAEAVRDLGGTLDMIDRVGVP